MSRRAIAGFRNASSNYDEFDEVSSPLHHVGDVNANETTSQAEQDMQEYLQGPPQAPPRRWISISDSSLSNLDSVWENEETERRRVRDLIERTIQQGDIAIAGNQNRRSHPLARILGQAPWGQQLYDLIDPSDARREASPYTPPYRRPSPFASPRTPLHPPIFTPRSSVSRDPREFDEWRWGQEPNYRDNFRKFNPKRSPELMISPTNQLPLKLPSKLGRRAKEVMEELISYRALTSPNRRHVEMDPEEYDIGRDWDPYEVCFRCGKEGHTVANCWTTSVLSPRSRAHRFNDLKKNRDPRYIAIDRTARFTRSPKRKVASARRRGSEVRIRKRLSRSPPLPPDTSAPDEIVRLYRRPTRASWPKLTKAQVHLFEGKQLPNFPKPRRGLKQERRLARKAARKQDAWKKDGILRKRATRNGTENIDTPARHTRSKCKHGCICGNVFFQPMAR